MLSLKLSRSLYHLPAIKMAIKAYCHLADISLIKLKKHYLIKFNSINNQFKLILKDEFCNYVLALGKK
ncbi:MAG: HxsD-like protein [Candidatus Omnitrophota bacterium]